MWGGEGAGKGVRDTVWDAETQIIILHQPQEALKAEGFCQKEQQVLIKPKANKATGLECDN